MADLKSASAAMPAGRVRENVRTERRERRMDGREDGAMEASHSHWHCWSGLRLLSFRPVLRLGVFLMPPKTFLSFSLIYIFLLWGRRVGNLERAITGNFW